MLKSYICSCRLEEACRLIKNSNLPLSDIAAACGYKDYINFSKMFSKKYGVSPKRYK
ncbi:MAG: helix-turn-helix domain-containing protein [Acutalibacteraceae bacterium]